MPIGKIIEIEGTDGSGKETQANLLAERLNSVGIDAIVVSFPHYTSTSSLPVREFLNGYLGDRNDLSPMEISLLYAFDRSVTFRNLKLNELLENGTWIILDRYVGSNMIHNTIDLDNKDLLENITKIKTLEYYILGLPKPDRVFYLYVPRDISRVLIEERGLKKDINESDEEYMTKVSNNGKLIANILHWTVIDCHNEDDQYSLKPKQVISDIIFNDIEYPYL